MLCGGATRSVLLNDKSIELITEFQHGFSHTDVVRSLRSMNRPYITNIHIMDFPLLSLNGIAHVILTHCGQMNLLRVARWCDEDTRARELFTMFATHTGNVSVLQYYHSLGRLCPTTLLWDIAAGSNQLDVLRLLRQVGHTGCSSQALVWAAGNGHLHAVQIVLSNFPIHSNNACTKAWSIALKNGNIKIVELLEYYGIVDKYVNYQAALYGHMDLLIHLLEKFPMKNVRFMDSAANGGHLHILEYLHQHGYSCTTAAMDSAAGENHKEVVEFLHKNRSEGCTREGIDNALANGHWCLVTWLVDNRQARSTGKAINEALDNGNVSMLTKLLDILKVEPTVAMAERAATRGDLTTVRFLCEQCRVPFAESIMTCAVRAYQLELAVALERSGHYPTGYALEIAAKEKVDKFIKAFQAFNYSNWSSKIMDTAAENGNIAVVKFLHENRTEGCTVTAMNEAAIHGSLETVEFLHKNRTEGCTIEAMNGAAANGFLSTVKFLHEERSEGCTIAAMNLAARNGHLPVVKFLHEERTEGCTVDAMNMAARNGHLSVVKFLHEERTEGCTVDAMNQAAKYGLLNVVIFLNENRTEGCTIEAIDNGPNGFSIPVVLYIVEHRKELCVMDIWNRMDGGAQAKLSRHLSLISRDICCPTHGRIDSFISFIPPDSREQLRYDRYMQRNFYRNNRLRAANPVG